MLAFKGQSVLFECQAAGWYPQPTLQWKVNDKKVNTRILVIFYKIHTNHLIVTTVICALYLDANRLTGHPNTYFLSISK